MKTLSKWDSRFRILALALAAFALPFSPTLMAKPARFLCYVGTYTGPKSQGIYAFRFDAEAGRAEAPTLAAEVSNPSFLAAPANGRFLYAVNELPGTAGRKGGGVTAFAIERPAGKLKLLSQVSSGGDGPCHIALHPGGRWAFVANYGGGSVASLPIREDGALGEAVSFHQHTGSSVNPARQTSPHAHGVTLDPAGRLLFVPDLGLDKILAYRFDPATGRLAPNDPPFTSTKPGAGPRHFVFAPGGRHAYAVNELDSTVTAYAYDAAHGSLREIQTVSTLPDRFAGRNSTAEIQVDAQGRYLYCSNRGYDSIALFALDRSGTPKLLANVNTLGKTPRHFALDPTGEWLWAANQDSSSLNLFRVEPKQGRLFPTDESLDLTTPVCVIFVEGVSPHY
jgi:6-phosphogluconolactonase